VSSGADNLFFDFIEDYYAESEEHLAAARRGLLVQENATTDAAASLTATDDLLRSFHSLKGLSSMVGMMEIAQAAHLMEEYLRELRSARSRPNTDGINALRSGVNAIEQVISARRKGDTPPDITAALAILRAISAGDRADLESSEAPQPAPATLWRFTFTPSQELTSAGVNVTAVRERLRQIGSLRSGTPRVGDSGQITFDFVVSSEKSVAQIEALLLSGMEFGPAEPEATPQTETETAPPTAAGSSFVRVDTYKLDELMRMVGELVISRAHFNEQLKGLERNIPASEFRPIQEVNVRMERQIHSFREAVMRIRMVPIRQVFERMRYVISGLERDAGKRARFEMHGAETEIDKLIVDRMMDPLIHMVRNAVSHGLEGPAQRTAAGKPAEGRISVSARTTGEKVTIVLEDDGRGVDIQKVAEKAGVTNSDSASFDRARLLDIISTPGFSTREDADLTSGRGVGMDVVVSTVRQLGGTLSMDTEAGRFTRFTITLPLTLLILNALLITVGDQRFAVSQSAVQEIIAVDDSEFKKIGTRLLVQYRGSVLPVVPVWEMFRMSGNRTGRFHILVIGTETEAVGLCVQRVTGQREIVVRPISDPNLKVPAVIGATELGDGRPVLIVDAEALVRLGRQKEGAVGS